MKVYYTFILFLFLSEKCEYSFFQYPDSFFYLISI